MGRDVGCGICEQRMEKWVGGGGVWTLEEISGREMGGLGIS